MIIITGQTATGKTNLALKYAKKYDGELVNFDSRQVYQYLDIITGKDKSTIKQYGNIAIHLYDIVSPDKYFSSYDYVILANKVIRDIVGRGKTPILVGGTYFYLKHLLYGFDTQAPPNLKLREKLNKKPVKELQSLVRKSDPQFFAKMNNSDRNNPRRLIRRIEIMETGAKTVGKKASTYPDIKIVGIRYKEKDDLIAAIKFRVNERLKQGAVEEVKSLLKKGYKSGDPGLKTIGYQQIIRFLNGQISKKQAVEEWGIREVQYAKRQYTFMKKDKNIIWREI